MSLRRAVLLLALVVTACPAACLFSLGEVRTGWCDAHGHGALFCKDFDTADHGGWKELTLDSGTQTASLTGDYVSPPYAFRFGVTDIPQPPGYTHSLGSFEANDPASEAHLAFDLKIEQLPAGDEPILLYIGTAKNPLNSLKIPVHSVDGQTTSVTMVDETGGSVARQWSDAPTVGKWRRIFIDLALAPSPKVTASLGDPGTTSGTQVADMPLSGAWTQGPPGFSIGIAFTGSAPESVLLDNVVFSVK